MGTGRSGAGSRGLGGSKGAGRRREEEEQKSVESYVNEIEKKILEAKEKAEEIMDKNISDIPFHVFISLTDEKNEILRVLDDAKKLWQQGFLRGVELSDEFLKYAHGYVINYGLDGTNSSFVVHDSLDLRSVYIEHYGYSEERRAEAMKGFADFILYAMNGVVNKAKYYQKK